MEDNIIAKPEIHKKGWGYESWIVNNEKYCGKILHFYAGKKFSLHYHKIKDETFYVLKGKFKMILYDSLEDYNNKKIIEKEISPGDTIHIWPGRIHRLIALEEGEIIEFSSQHFEEDSYRIEPGDSQISSL
ncbi:MAG: cupin domain-containing protein [Nanoarchaeota archaeon]|nr:cupin domain-containing protein [Nanoarchaeota archaeon]